MQLSKFKHFFFNKYVVKHFSHKEYFLSYNYKFKTLWYRVPKVASRSINQHFIQNSSEGENLYSGYGVGYIPGMFKNYTKFSFVREPAAKLISAFKNKVLEDNYFRFSAEEHSKMQNLENFLSWIEDHDINTIEKHLRAQHTMIDLNHIDFLGRFENFNEDYSKLCDRIGLPFEETPQLNKTKKRDLSFSASQLSRVHKLYEKDYQLFYPNL